MELKLGLSSTIRAKMAAALIATGLLVQTSSLAYSHSERTGTGAQSSAQERYYSVSLPAKDRLNLVTRMPIAAQGELVGEFVAYDDLTTTRPTDYLELYNGAGALLAVSWFDRFGIERLALDQGLVQRDDKLEGTFVLVVSGDSI
jgi:hypothetical protein